jgi:hypothetical protein
MYRIFFQDIFGGVLGFMRGRLFGFDAESSITPIGASITPIGASITPIG